MKELIERIRELFEDIRSDDIRENYYFGMVDYENYDKEDTMVAVERVIKDFEEKQANKTFIDRLKEEREELKERLGKLQDFILSDSINNINEKQANLLRQQSAVMFTYLDILNQRLEDLENKEEK